MEKKITLNTKIFSFLFIFLGILNTISQNDNGQIDAPGDIAFVAYHDDDDGFSFILLDDCPNNTSIRFTDEEWNGTAFVTPTGEGEVLWTNNTGNTITKGNIINITDADDNSGGITASSGTASESDTGFSTSNIDELFAFTGTRAAPGTFLAFIGDINGNSLANTGLTDGVTANIITQEGYYNGSTICNGSLADCAALINTSSSNWSLGGYSFPSTIPSSFSGSTFNGSTPTINGVSSSSANGTYKVGDIITITVTFSENVTVTGTPQITLETGTTDRTINYTSGSGTGVLTFNYTVQTGDISTDLDYAATSALALNGATIQNGSGTNADITLATPGAANSLGANKTIVVDGVVPTITSTSSSTANGTYKTGDVISITTTFTEAVTVIGTPQITIETGSTDRTVNYTSGTGTSTLTFNYIVQSGDESTDLDYVATNSLTLNSGTIKDAAGNDATLTLATPGAANSLGNNKAIVIDGVTPTVMSASSSTANGSYKTGDVIVIATTFSEAVAVTGTPQITLETGATDRTINYTAGSGTSTLTFNYTIQAGDESTDLDYVATNSLILNSGTIKDAAGNDATLTLATPGAANSLGANKAIVVDGVVPTVMSVNVPASATYTSGQNLDFTVNFNENIVVNTTNGTPQIAITIGSTLRQAAYISGSGTSSLLFRHTVIVGDLDTDGITIGSLANNMGTLKDTSGNDANLTLNSVSSTTGVLVGNPTITWTGTNDNNWNTAVNWNTNTVPTNSSNIIIPNGLTNYPTISSSVTVNSINIASGASLIANATVTAPVTYNRNLPTTNWYLVAPPVNNETTQDIIANHTFATGSGANIGVGAYNNDHATNTWNYLNISSTGPVISGTGVSMKLDAPGDVSITGNINVTNVAIPVFMGGRDNFNLIGNPFTSYINSAVLAGDNSVIENGTFWLWDGSQYQTYNNASPINIAPAQGFFVEANTNTTIVFSTANQSHQSSDTFMRQAPKPSFELFLENDGNKKSTKVFYVANKTAGFDKGYDSKMFSGVTHDFAVFTELLENNEGKKLAIQTLPNSDYQKMIIPVGIIGKAGEQITFSINSKNIPSGIQLYLEDRENNVFTNLSNKNYTVSLKSNTNNSGQFYIHTSAKKPNNTDIKEDIQNVNIYKSINNNITISGLQTDKYSVNIYSILGKKIMTSEFKATGTHVVELPKIASGVYVVELSSSIGKVSKKIILE
ncbi:T9SS type A sorting domain-containing protein [Tenacibaculum soleae]|uniref:T9SS type A sorting domain-containing protein n=1 Tax=Tenacibaculum soleae TaxID=447689 RepID=UPI002300FCAF|nr:T9SS type A sorting domain-containing protein [Tenacibaculum soleae]